MSPEGNDRLEPAYEASVTADADNDVGKRLVVVLSMHRSGSSVLTRALALLGLDLGSELMKPAKGNNEKGFFEDAEIVDLNERVLGKLGRSWSDLRSLDPVRLGGPEFSNERIEASELVARRLQDARLFAFKDPRTAVLLPFWQCVFADMDCTVDYVLGVRNPLSVAHSLSARDGILHEKGVALWARYTLEAVRGSIGSRTVFVAFDKLVSHPAQQLERIARSLDLPLPDKKSPEFTEFVTSFLDDSLRHHRIGRNELHRSGHAPPSVLDLYDLVYRQCGSGKLPDVLIEEVEEIGRRMDDLSPAYALIETLESMLRSLNEEIGQKNAQLSDQELTREQGQAAHDQAVAQRDEALAEIESRTLDYNRLEIARAEVDASHDQAVAERDAALAEIESRKQDYDRLEQVRAEVHAAHDHAVAERDAALAEIGSLKQDYDRLEQVRAEVHAAHDHAVAERDAALAEIESRKRDLDRLQGMLADLRFAYESAAEERETALKELESVRANFAQLEIVRSSVQDAHDRAVAQRDDAVASIEHQRIAFEDRIATLLEQAEAEKEEIRLNSEQALDAVRMEGFDLVAALEAQMHSLLSEKASIEAEGQNLAATVTEKAMSFQAQALQLQSRVEELVQQEWRIQSRHTDVLHVVQRLSAERTHLAKALAETAAEIDTFKNSTSWKVTAPMRVVARMLRRRTVMHQVPASSQMAPLSTFLWKAANPVASAIRQPVPMDESDGEIVYDRRSIPGQGAQWVAVIIHAFHPQLLPEMLRRLEGSSPDVVLYVTTPAEKTDIVQYHLANTNLPACLLVTPNRGRDIAPFLFAHRVALEDGAPLILKLHTKQSPQLDRGDDWRNELLDSLVSRLAFERALEAMAKDPSLGLLAPAGHLLCVSDYMGSNRAALASLCARLGIASADMSNAAFAAGSMYFVRPTVFGSLLDLRLSAASFENEAGQLDGTLAHAIERVSGLLVRKAGLRIATIESPDTDPEILKGRAYRFLKGVS